jgi:hypothetical protein
MADVDMGTLMSTHMNPIKGHFRNWSVRHLFILMLFLSLAPATQSADFYDSEQKVKAAFIHHFCAYVTWPQAPHDAHYIVGIAASNKTTRLVKHMLEDKQNGACKFKVRIIRPEEPLHNIHILYVTRDAKFPLSGFQALTQNPAVLTITEESEIPSQGMINFIMRDNYVRFQISKSRAEEVGLKMSSQLLEVAVLVN